MRRPLIMGNWKMNGSSMANESLLTGLISQVSSLQGVDIAVCPPAVYLGQVLELVSGTSIDVGAQNLSEQKSGAFTGEISGDMLRDLGVTYTLVGHSERRSLYGETNELVAAKTLKALEVGLVPVLCVGETLEERKSSQMDAVLAGQINAVIELCGADTFGQIIVAYEPVWAIGTGETATPQQAQDAHAFIRGLIAAQSPAIAERVTILYGGSMNEKNAAELLAMADVDGGLVGGASLKADSFATICKAAAE
ncbi:triose-phosphate isomerase [Marinobacterium sp. LSUCC0821]|uniref:triose-phosphate isomerase n=1 Tax=Marinobacterium sp. LSUCC0821 TaxID=2668067 RepID=UPI00145181DE|nr:triose-phosphate isomerase [Marinobacterium sp. LSUCC0821]QJD71032.1 triose-phosphate isomerase [Marinobacterium sp. LSUCC0821]